MISELKQQCRELKERIEELQASAEHYNENYLPEGKPPVQVDVAAELAQVDQLEATISAMEN